MRASFLSLGLVVSLAVGCAKEAPVPPAPVTASARPESGPRDGGRLVRRLETEPKTLSSVLQTTDDERQVLSYLYDPLIDFDQNMSPIPATVRQWTVSDGGRTYTMRIDPRATFSDGQPVLAGDVVFTLHKILDEDSLQFAAAFEALDREKTKAIDDRTVRVVFTEPRAGQLLAFNIGVMPEHVYAKENFAKTRKVVGNGPYVLARRGRDRSLLLVRREDYWRTKPHIQSILFRPIADDAVAWKAMENGQIDTTRVPNDLWYRVRQEPAVRKRIEFFSSYQPIVNCIAWNLRDPLFDDVRVRRALAMAFDRNAVIKDLYHGQARPLTGPFTPDVWANDPNVLPIELNPQGATALLQSAGWRDTDDDGILDRGGAPFAFTLLIAAGSDTSTKQSQVLQASLAAIGVRMEITPLDAAAFFDRVMKRNYQAAFMAWVNDPDPDPYSLFHSKQLPPNGLNIVGYSNPEADELMEKGRVELDPAQRTEIYHHLHEILARDQPYLWMLQSSTKTAVNRRVQNVQLANRLGLYLWYPGPFAWWIDRRFAN